MQKPLRIDSLIRILKESTKHMPAPASVIITERYGRDPYLILVSCLLSLRAKDTASLPVSVSLFKHARTPQQMVALPIKKIESIIYSVGFYHNKARQIVSVSNELIKRFDCKVPDTYQDLISIKGIGPKTANLVLSTAFGVPALIVDVHVHRISNRLGLIKTKTPQESQKALERIIPKHYWNDYSRLLVTWGQNVCLSRSPLCSQCPLRPMCKRVGVTNSR